MSNRTFNLKDLSLEISEVFDLTQQRGAAIAGFVFDRIRDELTNGKQVRIHKFGTFTAKSRAAGVARNPINGRRVNVPSRKVVRLGVSPFLRKHVNGGVWPKEGATPA